MHTLLYVFSIYPSVFRNTLRDSTFLILYVDERILCECVCVCAFVYVQISLEHCCIFQLYLSNVGCLFEAQWNVTQIQSKQMWYIFAVGFDATVEMRYGDWWAMALVFAILNTVQGHPNIAQHSSTIHIFYTESPPPQLSVSVRKFMRRKMNLHSMMLSASKQWCDQQQQQPQRQQQQQWHSRKKPNTQNRPFHFSFISRFE